MLSEGVVFPWTHSIGQLLEVIEKKGIQVPEEIKESVTLSPYAVSTRYPGDYEPIDEEEYQEAVRVAEKVYEWVAKIMEQV